MFHFHFRDRERDAKESQHKHEIINLQRIAQNHFQTQLIHTYFSIPAERYDKEVRKAENRQTLLSDYLLMFLFQFLDVKRDVKK